ncbi:hypothetical protein B0T14DRAFT_499307 [Immersiella caudata]|uniref:F-box domain-containing protein n=1 Tax=Immersiella caudata TaxID=314043 RepID=A0AA39WEJ9_9PEZI|nr:hypothetical protein B0T14DRAFT_499307 [Immersiella caudata]
MASIITIPEEPHCEIAGYLGFDDLKNLKDVCKVLWPCAMRELLSKVRIYPSKKKRTRCNGIRANPTLKKSVRHVELNAVGPRAERFEHQHLMERALTPLDAETQKAFNALYDFVNLTSV